MQSLQRFIAAELAPVAAGLELTIGGSYLSDKAAPGDIDCTVCLPFADIPSRGPLITLAGDGAKGRIWYQYGVEFYVTIDHPGASDFRAFFQYVGEKTAIAKNLDRLELRGAVKLNSWTPG